MSVLDSLRRMFTSQPATVGYPWVSWTLPEVEHILGMPPGEVYRTQPYLRTVVSFVARNIAQLGLHTFVRVDETDRQRDRSGPLAQLIAHPNPTMTGYELMYGLVADLALYDEAYWMVMADATVPWGWSIYRVPPDWVKAMKGDAFTTIGYRMNAPGAVQEVIVPASDVLEFHGWHPGDVRSGSSPIAALKSILAEQVQAMRYRDQVWQRGGRVSSVITRPAGHTWTDDQRKMFRADWNSKFAGDGSQAGGTPILEDGMTLSKVDFSAHEQEFVEGAKLALSTVAAVYHVNPTMIGMLDNANYSNVREFRKSLYGDTLGPTIAMIEDRINSFLVPKIDNRDGLYVEFNIAEKLQGNFEEQAAALQAATGAPWLLRSEARARMNLPAIPDAERLVVPLNVLTGGQASPQDSAPKAAGVLTKAAAPQGWQTRTQDLLKAFFARQEKVVRSRLGSKAGPDWWDTDRWDSELADDLMRVADAVATEIGRKTAESLGYSEDEYDPARTVKFLRAVSESRAASVNAATRYQIEDALESDDPKSAIDSVWNVASGQRSGAIAGAVVTAFAAFGTTEAAKQVAGEKATKTWVTGADPRPTHRAMNGQTVGIDEKFSNGAMWPGDEVLSADETAGCNCSISVSTQ